MSQPKTTRRSILRHAALGGVGFLLAQRLGLQSVDAQEEQALPVKAKSIIVLWMNGGPSHIDTFDPKSSGTSAGPFKAIATRTPGLEICEHMPQIAQHTDKLAVIRSMTSKEGNHERARFLGHTGYAPNATAGYPSFGSWISAERSSARAALPSFVSVGGPSAGPGFLGVEHAPFVHRQAGKAPENAVYGHGVDGARFDRRMKALAYLESGFGKSGGASVASRRGVFRRAVSMMRTPELSAFDLSSEPEAVKAAYGDSNFGRGCLLARRLVEVGVPVVEVTLGGWDTHQNNFDRSRNLMGALDPAMATLLSELAARDLLDTTLVLWMGDFGRTPNINGNDGRDHYPRAWSAVLAGGGVRGGIVHGATDDEGAAVVRDPVTIPDLYATLATQLGVAPDKVMISPGGRPIAITDKGKPIAALTA